MTKNRAGALLPKVNGSQKASGLEVRQSTLFRRHHLVTSLQQGAIVLTPRVASAALKSAGTTTSVTIVVM
ncbi:hypothetical protein ACQR1W_18320 [Bradyrhizobium sp. HKCCYLS1011]|uniref:hypothetical protein n=1 Tax=Bradyrhizobium sp. HKCCYLS1011 TaxID=3420733 RepID=UPI003EC0594A